MTDKGWYAIKQRNWNISQNNSRHWSFLKTWQFVPYSWQFFFIIQRVKTRAIPCPHQQPTRVITQFRLLKAVLPLLALPSSKYPVRWPKLLGSARSGSTALSYWNCVITPGWLLMRVGYRTCFHTLYDEKNLSGVRDNLPSFKKWSVTWIVLTYVSVSLFNGISTFVGHLMPKPFS